MFDIRGQCRDMACHVTLINNIIYNSMYFGQRTRCPYIMGNSEF